MKKTEDNIEKSYSFFFKIQKKNLIIRKLMLEVMHLVKTISLIKKD